MLIILELSLDIIFGFEWIFYVGYLFFFFGEGVIIIVWGR